MTNTGQPSRLRIDGEPTMPVADPAGRILLGGTIALLAGILLAMPTLDGLFAWLAFFFLFGAAMVVSGLAQALRNRRVRCSIARAELEWPDICSSARQAAANGEGLSRMLQRRGFRDSFVRRWLIAWILQDGVVLSSPSSPLGREALSLRSRQPPDDHTWLQLRDRTSAMLPIANPKLRILLGCLMGIGALGFLGMRGYVFQWAFLFGALGGALAFSGLAQIRRECQVRAEVERARLQWPELLELAVGCDKQGLTRALQRTGYREYYVRRWLVQRLRPTEASTGEVGP